VRLVAAGSEGADTLPTPAGSHPPRLADGRFARLVFVIAVFALTVFILPHFCRLSMTNRGTFPGFSAFYG
jgi:hypothetical protein